MFIEDRIMHENLLTREHIDEIYNLFTILCPSEKFYLVPLDFFNIFSNLTNKKGFTVSKDYWDSLFNIIDHDRDGQIKFQDFIRYIYFHLKIYCREIGDKIIQFKLK